MRARTLARIAAVLFAWLAGGPRDAVADARWTEIIVAEGTYADMQANLQATGASDDVNVVVWHNYWDWMTGNLELATYYLLNDTNTANPPGECCPTETGPCCGSQDIAPADMGVTSNWLSKANLGRFLDYVRTQFPSEHYLLVLRGVPYSNSELLVEGLTLMDLADVINQFNLARGDQKLDVLTLAFCLSGSADWSYAFKDVAEVYVGPPNFTNPPVTARWRVHRWSRELIRNPALNGRQLASKMLDIFTDTTQQCIDQGDNCSNLLSGEPWTAGAEDLTEANVLARGVRDFVCAYLPAFDATVHQQALDETTRYGYTAEMPLDNLRYDLKHFAMNLKARTTDATLIAAIDGLIAAHDAYVMQSVVEPTGFNDQSYGLSAYFNNGYSVPEKIGPFMYDSLWKAMLRKAEAGTDLPAATGVDIDTPASSIPVGQSLTLTALDTHPSYGTMCPTTSVEWQVSNPSVATIDDPAANPATLKAHAAGTVLVTATAGANVAQVAIDVIGNANTDGGPGGDAGPEDPSSSGCTCRAAGAHARGGAPAFPILGLALGLALALGARRRPCPGPRRRHGRAR